MKIRSILSAALLASIVWNAAAQSAQGNESAIYTIIANPGENASCEMRINWHTDSEKKESICVYTKAGDTAWEKSKTAQAMPEFCTIFDSIYSKKPNGDDFYENVRFWRNAVALENLEPATQYMYRIEAGNETSEVHYFKTAPQSGAWTAGIISDFHAYTPAPQRLESAMNMLATLEKQHGGDLDFILHAGDLAAWGGSYSFWRDMYGKPYFAKYMWGGVNGNHDDMSRGFAKQTNQFFRNVNNNPVNGYPGEEGVCYHFRYGDVLFITLNNENMRQDEQLAQAQEWVKEVITSNPAPYIVVVEHYQWFMGNDGKSSQYDRWKELFDEYGVDLAISGNNHIYARTNAIYAGKETDGTKGTVYLQTTSSDNERGRELEEWTDNTDLIKFRWTEGSHTVSALIMNADCDKLTLTLYDRNGNVVDQFSVLSKRRAKSMTIRYADVKFAKAG